MFCPNCGKELNDDAAFCGGCGSQIKKDAGEATPAATAATSEQASATPKTAPAASATSPATQQAAPSATASVQPSAATTAKATASAVSSAAKANPKLFIGIGAALVVVIIGIVLAVMFMTGGFTGGQTAGTFKQAFEAQEAYLSSVPSSTYVKESPYKLASCNVTDIQKKNDDWVTAKIEAVAENDVYKVKMQVAADYYNYPNASRAVKGDYSNYQFEVLSSEVEAKSGITKDDEHGLDGVEAELSEDGRSCTVASDATYGFWFADSSISSQYRYTLNGNGWNFDSEDVIHNVTYKDIDGAYAAKSGDMLDFTGFEISGLNAETGSFAIKIALKEDPGSYSTRVAAEATLQATIDPKRDGKDAQKDGYSYYFEAKGSSTGGHGTASLTGYLTVGEDGSKTIKVANGSIDTTYNHTIGNPNQGDFDFSGVLYKQ